MEDSSRAKARDDLIVEARCALWESLPLTVVCCCFCARGI